jgi:hypothetical protein
MAASLRRPRRPSDGVGDFLRDAVYRRDEKKERTPEGRAFHQSYLRERVSGEGRSTLGCGSDLAGDGRCFFVCHDLLGDLSPMNRNLAGKLECKSHSVPFDDRHSNDAEWGRGVADDDFLAFATGDDEHDQVLLPEAALPRTGFGAVWL